MRSPLSYRHTIPFFYDKSSEEFRRDVYERYEEMVVRQSLLHLSDAWGSYPMAEIIEYADLHVPDVNIEDVVELGCGVGRWIATVARSYPDRNCWGIDYSYQMLRQAQKYWVEGATLHLDASNKGFRTIDLVGHHIENLNLGLAKAERTPFDSESQDLVLSSFLLDRLDDPLSLLKEGHRILRPQGRMVVISPLNFSKAAHWQGLYPPSYLQEHITPMGFHIVDWKTDMIIYEPIDIHGNHIVWKCVAFVVEKINSVAL